jgi:hypothetical protein
MRSEILVAYCSTSIPEYLATGSLVLGSETLVATATFKEGYAAIAALVTSKQLLAGTVATTSAVFTANASLGISKQLLSAQVELLNFTATATLLTSKQLLGATVTVVSPSYTADAGLVTTSQTLIAQVEHDNLARSAVSALVTSRQVLGAFATFVTTKPGLRTVTGTILVVPEEDGHIRVLADLYLTPVTSPVDSAEVLVVSQSDGQGGSAQDAEVNSKISPQSGQ